MSLMRGGPQIFVWDDCEAVDGQVTEYRTFEGHREDITAMVALPARQLLATGDYEGRINVFQLFTGDLIAKADDGGRR